MKRLNKDIYEFMNELEMKNRSHQELLNQLGQIFRRVKGLEKQVESLKKLLESHSIDIIEDESCIDEEVEAEDPRQLLEKSINDIKTHPGQPGPYKEEKKEIDSLEKAQPDKKCSFFNRIMLRDFISLLNSRKYSEGIDMVESLLEESIENPMITLVKDLVMHLTTVPDLIELSEQDLAENLRSPLNYHILSRLFTNSMDYTQAIQFAEKALNQEPDNFEFIHNLALLSIYEHNYLEFKELIQNKYSKASRDPAHVLIYAIIEYFFGKKLDASRLIPKNNTKIFKGVNCEGLSEIILEEAKEQFELGNYNKCIKIMKASRKLSENWVITVEWLPNVVVVSQFQGVVRSDQQLSIDSSINEEYHQVYFTNENFKLCKIPAKNLNLEEVVQESNRFLYKFHTFVINSINRKSPVTISDLRPLLEDKTKSRLINEYLKKNIKALTSSDHKSSYYDFNKGKNSQIDELPESLAWMEYLQCILHMHSKNFTEALAAINRAISIVPDSTELHLIQGKVHKNLNNLDQAIQAFAKANNLKRTIKYLLRTNDIDQAIALRGELSNTDEVNIEYIPNLWYNLELGEAKSRQRVYQEAADEFRRIEIIFREVLDNGCYFIFGNPELCKLNQCMKLMKFVEAYPKHKYRIRACVGLEKIHREDSAIVTQAEIMKLIKILLHQNPTSSILNEINSSITQKL